MLLPTHRKAAGSLKIVHEKYSEKAKNPEETQRYLAEFHDAVTHNEAMESYISKVRLEVSYSLLEPFM